MIDGLNRKEYHKDKKERQSSNRSASWNATIDLCIENMKCHQIWFEIPFINYLYDPKISNYIKQLASLLYIGLLCLTIYDRKQILMEYTVKV